MDEEKQRQEAEKGTLQKDNASLQTKLKQAIKQSRHKYPTTTGLVHDLLTHCLGDQVHKSSWNNWLVKSIVTDCHVAVVACIVLAIL